MKLLYVASDQRVPGSTGGSVHVEEVARGLSARGHDVHVFALEGAAPPEGFALHASGLPFAHRVLRFTRGGAVGELMDALGGVDAVMERYYNFAGEGVRAAARRGVPSLLEVNSPLVDHPGSLKSALDGLLLVRPMKRLREAICREASALVTPLVEIVPESVAKEKVHRVTWGANVETFHPGVAPAALELPEGSHVVAFSGSFRPWHGADGLVRAIPRVLELDPEAFFLFVGEGEGRRRAEALAGDLGVAAHARFTGAVAYADMPSLLKLARVGVAPYRPSRLGQMRLGFYWSPLKIFEYMAMALPVVTLDAPELRDVVRPGEEGLLVGENDVEALAGAIAELLREPERAARLGRAARERVVARFSWQQHCAELERILEGLVGNA